MKRRLLFPSMELFFFFFFFFFPFSFSFFFSIPTFLVPMSKSLRHHPFGSIWSETLFLVLPRLTGSVDLVPVRVGPYGVYGGVWSTGLLGCDVASTE